MFDCSKCAEELKGPCIVVHKGSARLNCQKCGARNIVQLPPLSRPLVGLDQNAISEMTKLADPNFPKNRKNRLSRKWKSLFDICYECRNTLTVGFPLSPIVDQESSLFDYGCYIHRFAQYLASELFIKSPESISYLEVSFGFRLWLAGKTGEISKLPRDSIYQRPLGAWPSNLTANFLFPDQSWLRSEVNESRERLHFNLTRVYENWRKDKSPLNVIAKREAKSNGPALFRAIKSHIHKISDTDIRITHHGFYELFQMMLSEYTSLIGNDQNFHKALDEYFNSSYFCTLPHVQIRSLLNAARSRKIAAGMNAQKSSDEHDMQRIISFLPYADYLLLERHFASLVREITPRLDPRIISARVFATSELSGLCDTLQASLERADTNHLRMVEILYGKG